MQSTEAQHEPPEPATAEEAVTALLMSFGRLLRQRRSEGAMDSSALPLLKALSHLGPTRVTALAAELGFDASTVSRHVQGLEQRGLLERSQDPDDRRASRVQVSTEGVACLKQIGEARRADLREAMSDWSAQDREQLRVLLYRLDLDLYQVSSKENS